MKRMSSYDVKRSIRFADMLREKLSDADYIKVVRNDDGSIEIFRRGDRVVRITPFMWLRFYTGRYIDEKGWIKANDETAERISRFV